MSIQPRNRTEGKPGAQYQIITVITNESNGLYQWRGELLQTLMERGIHVSALTPFDLNVADLCGMGVEMREISFDRRGINPRKELKLLRQFKKVLEDKQPDLVITYTAKPNIYGGMVCRRLGIPYAANITGLGSAFEGQGILPRVMADLYRCALKGARAVFFENEANLRFFTQNRIINRKQACLLNGAGVSLDRFPLAPYPENEITEFLFLGRIMREKGIDELLDAVGRLNEEGVPCRLTVLGQFEEDYRERFTREEQKGILRYCGFQEDVRPYIYASDCLILPSWHEGMANVNLEAAASGRPVITSNIPGCREAVLDGNSGFFCESRNSESLYLTMKRFIELPKDIRAQMGLRGREHMQAHFDRKCVIETTLDRLGID